MKSPVLLIVAGLALPGSVLAEAPSKALAEAVERQVRSNDASAAAQKSIDGLRDQAQRMLEEYRDALRQTEQLSAYNEHLRRLVESQRAQKASLEQQVREIEVTRRDLVPLMLRMTNTLQQFVSLDRPFQAGERARQVADLQALMQDHEVNDAEKFRRLLEAYQAENGYGKTVSAYQGEITLDDKETRTVDFLRVGRIGLYYQTLDGRQSGLWNAGARRWDSLPAEYNAMLRKGIVTARQERPKELLPIVIEASEISR